MPGDLPTYDDFVQVARREFRLRNSNISADEIDRVGSDTNIIVGVAASMATEIMRHATLLYRQFFLDTAQGKELDRLISDRYGLLRQPAAPSKVDVTFSRPTDDEGPGTIAVGTRLASTDGKEYLTAEAAAFGAAALSVSGVATESVLAGRETHVDVGKLNKILDTIFDSTITVTNPEESAGGVDEETDEDFRERARAFFQAARRATIAAIEFGAKTVAGVKLATAIEITGNDNKPAAVVELYVADEDDNFNQTLLDDVTNALEFYRAAGICVDVKGGVVALQSITITLKFQTGQDTVKLSQSVKDALVALVNRLKISETLYEADILKTARTVQGVIVESDAVTVPVGDVVPTTGQFIRTRPDLIMFT